MSNKRNGARDGTTSVLYVRIPSELRDWLQEEADRRMVSLAYLTTRGLTQLRESIPPVSAA